MAASVFALAQENFDSFVGSAAAAIVRASRGADEVHPSVVDYFSKEYGPRVVFGSLDVLAIGYAGWLMKRVGKMLRRQEPHTQYVGGAPQGYYLFVGGQAEAYHPDATGLGPLTGGLIMSALGGTFHAGMKAGAKVDRDTSARSTIERFESVLSRRLPPAPTQAPEALLDPQPDHYGVLEVSKSASEDEVRAAYKKQAALSHTDKVARLHPKIRKVAEQHMVAVNQAYEAIKRERGWR